MDVTPITSYSSPFIFAAEDPHFSQNHRNVDWKGSQGPGGPTSPLKQEYYQHNIQSPVFFSSQVLKISKDTDSTTSGKYTVVWKLFSFCIIHLSFLKHIPVTKHTTCYSFLHFNLLLTEVSLSILITLFLCFFSTCTKISMRIIPFPFHLFSPFSFLSIVSVWILECCLKPLAWMTLCGQTCSCLSYITHHEFTCWGHLLIASAFPVGYQGNYTEHWLGSFSIKHLSQDIHHSYSHPNVNFVMSGELPELFPPPVRIILNFMSPHYVLLQTNDSERITWQASQTS